MSVFVRLTCALLGLSVLGLSQASACSGCGCCRIAPAPGPGQVVTYLPGPAAVPACCQAVPVVAALPVVAGVPVAPMPVAGDNKVAAAPADSKDEEAKIREGLAKLSAEDRKLAEGQKFCAVENDNRLGSMGAPVKIMLKGQPVFLCCKGCVEEAEKDADKTLAKVKELKKAAEKK